MLNEDADTYPALGSFENANVAKFIYYPGSTSAKYARFVYPDYNPNEWQHICVVTDYSAPSVTAYVDSVSVSVDLQDLTSLAKPTWSGLQLGGHSGGASHTWETLDGLLGRIRVWNTGLSATEVAAVYNSEKGFYQ